jgi:hypothetical protein
MTDTEIVKQILLNCSGCEPLGLISCRPIRGYQLCPLAIDHPKYKLKKIKCRDYFSIHHGKAEEWMRKYGIDAMLKEMLK